jgi:hypothetical protein
MNPDKTYTYNPDDFKWTMDNIVTEKYTYTPTGLTDAAYCNGKNWRMVPKLPFWWFLNPWKTVEDLNLSLLKAVADHADDAKERDEATERLRQSIYDLRNELDTAKVERDAANDAVRYLRNQRKKGKRRC